MGRFVRDEGEYVGAEVMRRQREEGTERKLVGLTLPGRSAPRAGYAISDGGQTVGEVTSGSYSPTLDTSIAMGYVFDPARRGREPGASGHPGPLGHRGKSSPFPFIPEPGAHSVLNPEDRRYTNEHEWIKIEDAQAGQALVGITEYAQDQLGDVVYFDLPQPGDTVTALHKMGEVESVKAVSDLFSPVSGEVTEINGELSDRPELVNEDPFEQGWIFAGDHERRLGG